MDFKFCDLSSISSINLQQISKLVYQTDPYIYPAMFKSQEDAITLISHCISTGKDEMFNAKNLFLTINNSDIIGIVLYYKGIMNWDKETFIKSADDLNISLPETFELVCENYFKSYADDELDGLVSIINVCIDESCRGQNIGKQMMDSFFSNYKNDGGYELFCLKDNESAYRLYKSCGFMTVSRQKAFTVDNQEIYSVRMIKNI